jgi:putative NADPH-quinone reductase
MNISVILAHPKKGSFNHAIADAAVETLQANGHEVIYHDLYEERFDPVLPDGEIPKDARLCGPVEQHCSEIRKADGIVIIHPNWWGQPPAILKGWVDRVVRPGVAYEFKEGDSGEGVPCGLLKAEVAIVFNTSNTPEERELEVFGDPLETIWKNCIFGLCGVKNFYRKTFGVIVTSTPQRRDAWLEEVRETVNRCFPR